MTNDGFRTQLVRQQLGHVPIKTTSLYIASDTTAATQYADGAAGTDTARPDGEGEGAQ